MESFSWKFSPKFMSKTKAVIFDGAAPAVGFTSFATVKILISFPWEIQRISGLSGYAKDPEAAADSLSDLLKKAETIISIRVGATAGLGNTSDRILQAVDFLKNKSSLKSKADWVTVLDGNQEGAYLWVHFLRCLNNLYHDDYPGALENLHCYFDYSHQNSDVAPLTLSYPYNSAVAAAMDCFFGCFRVRDSHIALAPEPAISCGQNVFSSLFISDDESRGEREDLKIFFLKKLISWSSRTRVLQG